MYLNLLIISASSIDTGLSIADKQEKLVNLLNDAGIDFNWCIKNQKQDE